MEVRAQPWGTIAAQLRGRADGRDRAALIELVERIGRSPYAWGLHGATSGDVVFVAQTDPFDLQRDVLQIAMIGEEIVFDFVESVFERRRWRARVPKSVAFVTLERFLHDQRWFASTPP